MLLTRVAAADVVFGALSLCLNNMENFWKDEIHLWVIGLSAHHVDPSDEQDDVGSKHVMLSNHLLKGVEYHVLVLSNALWHISKDDLETAVKDAQSVVLTF